MSSPREILTKYWNKICTSMRNLRIIEITKITIKKKKDSGGKNGTQHHSPPFEWENWGKIGKKGENNENRGKIGGKIQKSDLNQLIIRPDVGAFLFCYLHLFHDLVHLFRRQAGHRSGDGFWGFLGCYRITVGRLFNWKTGNYKLG